MTPKTHYATEISAQNKQDSSATFVHVHLVSDSTGETVSTLAKACLSQFNHVNYQEHVWSMVRSEFLIDQVIEKIKAHPGIVLFTIVDSNIRKKLMDFCHERRLPVFSVMDHFLDIFVKYLGKPGEWQTGMQHQLDTEYFSRIDAMQYSLMHDDGLGDDGIKQADIVVIGVSRTSKTPTCIYLANRGYKAANIPMVGELQMPEWLLNLRADQRPMVVCLVRDAESLVEIRMNRLKLIDPDRAKTVEQATPIHHGNHDYIDIDQVKQEVLRSKRLSARQNWPVIDVTKRSIEEASAIIMSLYEKRFGEDKP
ncbi:MAG: pyruvate, water dikinase regulatory protein [Alphaproteobacteria bacterium]